MADERRERRGQGRDGRAQRRLGVAGIGDFDGDGKSDILFQNDSGAAEWLLNGTIVTGGGGIGTVSAPGGSYRAQRSTDSRLQGLRSKSVLLSSLRQDARRASSSGNRVAPARCLAHRQPILLCMRDDPR